MCVCLHKQHDAARSFHPVSRVCGLETDSRDRRPGLQSRLCPFVTLGRSLGLFEPWFPIRRMETMVALLGLLGGASVVDQVPGPAER